MTTSYYYRKGENIRFQLTTPEEEVALFQKARAGDDEARDFLIRNHLLFAATLARRSAKGRLPDDDVVSAANDTLMKCFDRFDETRGSRFTSYLRQWIPGAIAQLWREMNPVKYPRRIPEWDGPTAPEPLESQAVEPEIVERDSTAFALEKLRDSMDRFLTPREKSILEQYYFDQKTCPEICVALGITDERVRTIRNTALGKLRRKLSSLREELL